MYPTINLGPMVFPTAGLLYLLGAWISLGVGERAAKRLDQNPDAVYGISATSLFAGLVGARLSFVMLFWPAFSENLLAIIWPLNSGYNLWGGLFFAAAAGFFYGRAKRMGPWATLDALIPGLITGLLFISLADFLAGPGFGTLSRVPWAISQFSMQRHPVQIYELIIGLTALGSWWRLARKPHFDGQLFLVTLSIYSAGRLFVDAFRENAWLSGSGIHILQVICLLALVGSLALLVRLSEQSAAAETAS